MQQYIKYPSPDERREQDVYRLNFFLYVLANFIYFPFDYIDKCLVINVVIRLVDFSLRLIFQSRANGLSSGFSKHRILLDAKSIVYWR